MRIFRVSGTVLLLALAFTLLFLLALAWLAVKVILWLLPFLIIVVAVWLILRLFHRTKKEKGAVDVEFRIMK
jgi:choline-glycine betaine transporter